MRTARKAVAAALTMAVLPLAGVLCAASPAAAAATLTWPAPNTPYTPQLSASKTEFGHYWIQDHGQRIALLGCEKGATCSYQLGLFRYFPGHTIDEKKVTDSDVLDFVSLPGLRLNTNWISAPAMKGVAGEMKLDTSDPTQMIIRLSWKESADEFGTQVLRVVYDQEMSRDVLFAEKDAGGPPLPDPHGAIRP